MRIWAHIADTLANGEACALVTVAEARGSTPRETGARMVVDHKSRFFGTIGGGTLELEAIQRAAKAASLAKDSFEFHTVSLGPDLGQCCGGRVKLAIEVFSQQSLGLARELAEQEAQGRPFGTQSKILSGKTAHRQLLDGAPPNRFDYKDTQGAETGQLIERFGDEVRRLYLFGAGHVGKAVILAFAPLPFQITWIDSRSDQFPGPVPLNVTKVCVSDPAAVVDQAQAGAFVLAMTHSHRLDEDIMAQALLKQRFPYCGVIGSQTKRARFRKRLKARGLDDTVLANMVCPVGIASLKSKQPAVIAAGIAVDLLERDEACRRQAAGFQTSSEEHVRGQ